MRLYVLIPLFFIMALPEASAMGRKPAVPPPVPPRAESEKPVKLSLDLWKCYEMAARRSEAVAIRKEEITRTQGSFLQATGEAIGDVDFVMTDFRQDAAGSSSPGGSNVSSTLTARERRERRFEYSQPLFQGFKALGALTGAGSLKQQRVDEWRRAQQLLFLDTVNSFYDYLRYTKDVEIIHGILELYRDRLEELKEWLDIGRSRQSEFANVKSGYENFQAELADTQGDLAVAKNLLAYLIGVYVGPDELVDHETPLEKPDVDVLQAAIERPDVEAAKHAVTTARSAVIVAQSDLWPKFTLDANEYEHREGFQSGISWDALFTLRVPLGKGGTTLGNIRDAVSRWREARLSYSLTQKLAEQEIQNALDRWTTSVERYRALEKAAKSAKENFDLQSEDYKRRLVTNIDVLQALQNLYQARRDENEAFYNVKKYYWQLQIAAGRCCDEQAPKLP